MAERDKKIRELERQVTESKKKAPISISGGESSRADVRSRLSYTAGRWHVHKQAVVTLLLLKVNSF